MTYLTTITIGGVVVNPQQYNIRMTMNLRFSAYSSVTIQRRGGTLPGLPDPWLGKPIQIAINYSTIFAGDVSSVSYSWANVGWVPTYQCRCLKARIDRVPFTDYNTLTDNAGYNLPPEDINAIPARQGRNIGQIVTDVLTGLQNATALMAKGVGNYVSLSPPTLPPATVGDLALMTIIPPSGVYVQGERIWSALTGFLRFWAPNHLPWIDPATGTIRILDKRLFANNTLTLGLDPIYPTPLSRNVGDCYQRVVVRGQPVAEPKMLSTSNGGLKEDFGYTDLSGTYTNAQAKAKWTPLIAQQDATAKDQGTCVCTDTLDVVVTSYNTHRVWPANYWDQTSTGALGVIQLNDTTIPNVNQFVTRRIVSCAAMSAGAGANCVLDMALPAITYNTYQIYGVTSGLGFVWKKYKVTNSQIAAALARQFTYPQPWVGSNGSIGVMTSYPMGSVCYSGSGNPPYAEWPDGITLDPTSGHIYFLQPTFTVAGNNTPSDVRALVAVNTGVLTATAPAAGYQGTSNAIEGLTETLTLTVGQWRDPISQIAMNAFAQEQLDSVKDAIVEGEAVYNGMALWALTPGQGLSITGNSYLTGWEGLNLPILEVELRWNSGTATQYTTTLHCSNRRASLTSAAFLRPARPAGGQQVGFVGGMGGGYAGAVQQSMGGIADANMDPVGTIAGQSDPGGDFGSYSTDTASPNTYRARTQTEQQIKQAQNRMIQEEKRRAAYEAAHPAKESLQVRRDKQAQDRLLAEEDRRRKRDDANRDDAPFREASRPSTGNGPSPDPADDPIPVADSYGNKFATGEGAGQ